MHLFIIISSFFKKDKRYVYAVYSQCEFILLLEQQDWNCLVDFDEKKVCCFGLTVFYNASFIFFQQTQERFNCTAQTSSPVPYI